MDRREYVAGLGVVAGIGLAGCFGDDPTRTAINEIDIWNLRDERITLTVEVEWDGDSVHDRSLELDAREGSTVDSVQVTDEWPDEDGVWRVSGDVDGGETTSITSDDALDEGIVDVMGIIAEESEQAVWWQA